MTYRTHLENLLDVAIQKSEKYFDVGVEGYDKGAPLGGQNAENFKKAEAECEAARSAYLTVVNFVKTNQIGLDDEMPD